MIPNKQPPPLVDRVVINRRGLEHVRGVRLLCMVYRLNLLQTRSVYLNPGRAAFQADGG